MRAGILDVLDTLELLQRRRSGRIEAKELREAEHRVQRRPQLVTHAREEFGLGAARRLERFTRLPLGAGSLQVGHVTQDHRDQNAMISLERGQRRFEGEFLAICAGTNQLLDRGTRPGAEIGGSFAERSGAAAARATWNEPLDIAADRVVRGRAEQSLRRTIEQNDPFVSVDRDDRVVDRIDQPRHADLAFAQRCLHVQPLGDVEEGPDRAVEPAVLQHGMRPVFDRKRAPVGAPEHLVGDVQLSTLTQAWRNPRLARRPRPTVGVRVVDQGVDVATEQVSFFRIAEHLERGAVDERAPALRVDAVRPSADESSSAAATPVAASPRLRSPPGRASCSARRSAR